MIRKKKVWPKKNQSKYGSLYYSNLHYLSILLPKRFNVLFFYLSIENSSSITKKENVMFASSKNEDILFRITRGI